MSLCLCSRWYERMKRSTGYVEGSPGNGSREAVDWHAGHANLHLDHTSLPPHRDWLTTSNPVLPAAMIDRSSQRWLLSSHFWNEKLTSLFGYCFPWMLTFKGITLSITSKRIFLLQNPWLLTHGGNRSAKPHLPLAINVTPRSDLDEQLCLDVALFSLSQSNTPRG